MTAITPAPASAALYRASTETRASAPGPALTAAPWAGPLIGLVFVLTVALFLVAVVTL